MVYTALQLISRGREAGISVVDLSKKTGYDAKNCHYLVTQLVELNLMYALQFSLLQLLSLMSIDSEKRKKSGVGANFVVHKYFFERSETWKDVLAEEEKANKAALMKSEEPDLDFNMDGNEDTVAPNLGRIKFDPIDGRHLSSLAIVRSRIETLLRNSPHNMHTMHDLLVTIVRMF